MDDNSWRKCAICGKYISQKDISDRRKTVSIEMCEYLKFDYGYIILEYYYQPAHKKCYNKKQKANRR